MKPQVSVIVLCWNHCEDLTKPFVKNFLEMTDGVNYELILVNNGSEDDTKAFLDSIKDPRVKVLHNPKNLGFGGGNNSALKEVEGKYILFMNNDIIIKDDRWLSKLYDYATNNPKTLVGAQLVDYNSATEFRHQNRPYINGWCLLIDADFIKKEGFAFNPEFGFAYFEDVELCQKAIRNGYKLKQIDIDIEHLGSKSSDQISIPTQFRHNRYVYRNLLYQSEKGDKLRIVFFAPGNYDFNDDSYMGKGVGGAEASLILLSRELAKLGHIVDVYTNTQVEGVFNGVNYFHTSSFIANDYSDVFILFRNSFPDYPNVYARLKIFWSCDQATTSDWASHIIPYTDMTFAISEYHRQYLYDHYPFERGSIEVIDLGVNAEEYETLEPKIPGQMIFCSVPKRGLEFLVTMFPQIQKQVPNATLVITSDYTLWGAEPLNGDLKEMFVNMPGVTFLGKIPRKDLVAYQKSSEIMAYPCNYDENFCISAIECIASGAVPVTTDIGALKTTIGDSGIVIKGQPGTTPYNDQFVTQVVSLLKDGSEDLKDDR